MKNNEKTQKNNISFDSFYDSRFVFLRLHKREQRNRLPDNRIPARGGNPVGAEPLRRNRPDKRKSGRA